MNIQNAKNITGDECEDVVLSYLTGQGWKVFTPQHGKGMADLVVYHEDAGCITYQGKTLAMQGGKQVRSKKGLANGLVTEGKRPRVVLKLKDPKRYYKDNLIDWMVGVDPQTKELYFYPHKVYSQFNSQLCVDKVKSIKHPEAPELKHFKEKRKISNLDSILD